MELLDSARQLVLDSCPNELDELSLDLLAITTMALFLRDEKLAKEKLPNILSNLTVYSEDRPIIEIAHEKLNNYGEDELLENGDACVSRTLFIDDEANTIEENCFLLISTMSKDNLAMKLITRTAHEFAHLLRYGGAKINGKEVKITKGLCVARLSFDGKAAKTKHRILEEGIVQRYAIQMLDALREFISDEDIPVGTLLYDFRNDYPACFVDSYALATGIVDKLCENKGFRELVDASFHQNGNSTALASYYNAAVNDPTAFTLLSRNADRAFSSVIQGDEAGFDSAINQVTKSLNTFNNRNKVIII